MYLKDSNRSVFTRNSPELSTLTHSKVESKKPNLFLKLKTLIFKRFRVVKTNQAIFTKLEIKGKYREQLKALKDENVLLKHKLKELEHKLNQYDRNVCNTKKFF